MSDSWRIRGRKDGAAAKIFQEIPRRARELVRLSIRPQGQKGTQKCFVFSCHGGNIYKVD